MKLQVCSEPVGPLLKDSLLLEARRWHHLHRPPATLAEWETMRTQLLAKLRRLAGLREEPCPLALHEHGRLTGQGYTIGKVTFQSRPGFRVTANLYRPEGSGPFPAVLNVHGHWSQGKIAERVAERGHVLARNGFVVLTVDAFGSGERGTVAGQYEYHGKQLAGCLLAVGRTLLGLQVHDNMRALDLLQSLPEVDGARLGVTGASGGGNQTMWLAAFDPRVKASVPVVSVGTFEAYITNSNCMCETLPGGLPALEEWAALALAAPNPMLVLNALQDSSPAFALKETVRSVRDAAQIFALYGVPEHLAYQTIDLPHGYHPPMLRHMLGWFNLHLRGVGHGAPCQLPPIRPVPEPDLKCFPDDRRPPEVPSILEFVAQEAAKLASAWAPAKGTIDRAAKRAALRDLLHLPEQTGGRVVSAPLSSQEEGRQITHLVVESAPGALLPVVMIEPPGAGPETLLAVHPDGKAKVASLPECAALLAAGKRVCLVDLRNTGESRWDTSQVARDHDAARTSLWLGRTVLGEWTHDLLAVLGVLAARGLARPHLWAWGEAGLAALATGALGGDCAGITTVQCPATFHPHGEHPTCSLSVFVPGSLVWGEVSLLAALPACPVQVEHPVTLAGAELAPPAADALRAEIADWSARLTP